MENQIINLDDGEISSVSGGPLPLVAFLVAGGLGVIGASIAAFNNGYTIGKDIAQNERR